MDGVCIHGIHSSAACIRFAVTNLQSTFDTIDLYPLYASGFKPHCYCANVVPTIQLIATASSTKYQIIHLAIQILPFDFNRIVREGGSAWHNVSTLCTFTCSTYPTTTRFDFKITPQTLLALTFHRSDFISRPLLQNINLFTARP